MNLENFAKRFGDTDVLKGIDLSVEQGEPTISLGDRIGLTPMAHKLLRFDSMGLLEH